MENKLGAVESRFADLIWQHAPIPTGELVALCQKELDWKRTTTYTVLKRLRERGLFENRQGTVVALITREEFYARQTESFVAESFGGSLPAFLAAFTHRKPLTAEEIEHLRRMIDDYGESK